MGKKILIGLAIILAIICVVCVFEGQLAHRFTPKFTSTPTSTMASVESPVTAKGVIVPARYVRLSFSNGGVVARILVKEGDKVETGQFLAMLDAGDLELAVRAAEVRLAQLKNGPRAEDIAVAESNYKAALARYEKIKAGPPQEELIIAKANLQKAEAALKIAQAEYDKIAWLPEAKLMPQAIALEQATIDYEAALARYNLLKASPSQADLKAAEAEVTRAKAELDKIKAGPRPEEIALAEIELKQALLALERAKLFAPFAGTVTAVNIREGEMVAPGTPVITIADLSELQVETTDLDEWGVARIKVNDQVKITVNAFKDKVLTGKVSAIALQGASLATGDVVYKVTITLDRQDPELRWGMTVEVEFGSQ